MTCRSRLFGFALCAGFVQGCLFTADQIEPSRSTGGAQDSPRSVFASLQRAYETRSLSVLEQLLADDYLFQADAASLANPSENTWGKSVELERHARMFRAIQNVGCRVQWDSMPHPEDAPRETTWTVWNLEMTMEYEGANWEVRGMADFRLRAVPQEDGTNLYQIVKWTDRP